MNKKLIALCSLALLTMSNTVRAQQCNTTNILPSNSPEQFAINQQLGTVIDARTGLEWSICSTGQTWQNGNCLGTPTNFANFNEALASVKGNALGADFRIPNIKELASIVERSCTDPAIDLAIFSGTLNAIYYSSTPDNIGNQHFSPTLGVKIIDFTNGTEFVPDVSKYRYVRLVRTIN